MVKQLKLVFKVSWFRAEPWGAYVNGYIMRFLKTAYDRINLRF